MAEFAANSRIANLIIGHMSWWYVAPLIALVATGGLGKSSSRSNDY